MEKKEYLNEQTYESGKKKLTKIALIVLICGIVIGLGLIITGAILSNNAKGFNIDLTPQEENNVALRTESEVQADINSVKPKINSLQNEISILNRELSNIGREEGLSENYYAKQKEIETKETELLTLKSELDKYENELDEINSKNDIQAGMEEQFENIFNSASNTISKSRYTGYYMIGIFIIIASCMVALAIYIFAKRREITAFTTQQVMPVAQEGIEKMAPTVGSAVGTIGKELAKGIKEGINEADDK